MFRLHITLIFIVLSAQGVVPNKAAQDKCVAKVKADTNRSVCYRLSGMNESAIASIELNLPKMSWNHRCFIVCLLEQHCLPDKFRMLRNRNCANLLQVKYQYWKSKSHYIVPIASALQDKPAPKGEEPTEFSESGKEYE